MLTMVLSSSSVRMWTVYGITWLLWLRSLAQIIFVNEKAHELSCIPQPSTSWRVITTLSVALSCVFLVFCILVFSPSHVFRCFLVLTPACLVFFFFIVWVQIGSHSVPYNEPQLWFLEKKLNKETAIMAKCLWLLSVEWLNVEKKREKKNNCVVRISK